MTKLSTSPSLLVPTLEIELNTFLVTQFWASIEKGCSASDCWAWIAYKNSDGYGVLYDGKSGKHYRANRLSWTIHNGLIPKGLVVCHACDNPNCANPSHLFLGDLLDNNADAVVKGRMYCAKHEVRAVSNQEARELISAVMKKERAARIARGLSGPKVGTKHAPKLTIEQVKEIFELLKSEVPSWGWLSVIARRYGVSQNNISRMYLGKGWIDIGRACGFTGSQS